MESHYRGACLAIGCAIFSEDASYLFLDLSLNNNKEYFGFQIFDEKISDNNGFRYVVYNLFSNSSLLALKLIPPVMNNTRSLSIQLNTLVEEEEPETEKRAEKVMNMLSQGRESGLDDDEIVRMIHHQCDIDNENRSMSSQEVIDLIKHKWKMKINLRNLKIDSYQVDIFHNKNKIFGENPLNIDTMYVYPNSFVVKLNCYFPEDKTLFYVLPDKSKIQSFRYYIKKYFRIFSYFYFPLKITSKNIQETVNNIARDYKIEEYKQFLGDLNPWNYYYPKKTDENENYWFKNPP